ncbi:MAG: protocatechuate 3,4-dioxygenase beta subunit [Candidatus Aldehydirespiratoraceae bacterium]|jgi:protocatechuate 3,4-dioxygenase beta subunit
MSDITRRTLLVGLGAGAIAVACSDSATTPTASTTSGTVPATTPTTASASTATVPAATLTTAEFDAAGSCVALPPTTAGPFGLTEQFIRSDITEGYPGHTLELGIRITDLECTPQPDTEVEIWHADATGDYSAFNDNGTGKDEAEGTTFLRGTQTTDQHGIVVFTTIAPGWYTGRAVHIHITVRLANGPSHTGQLFFDEAFLRDTFGEPAYFDNGTADTTNDSDSLTGNLTTEMLLRPTSQGSASRALTTLTI